MLTRLLVLERLPDIYVVQHGDFKLKLGVNVEKEYSLRHQVAVSPPHSPPHFDFKQENDNKMSDSTGLLGGL